MTLIPQKERLSTPLFLSAALCMLLPLFSGSLVFAAGRDKPGGHVERSIWISAIKDRQPVQNLKKEDLRLWIGKWEESISRVTLVPARPIVLGLLIDMSGSQRKGWPGPGLTLAPGFLQKVLQPGDKAFVVDFTDDVRLDTRPTADLTRLSQSLAVMGTLTPGGGTALYDAITASCRFLSGNNAGAHRVLLAITDGEDDASRVPADKTVKLARASGTTLYVLDTDSKDHRGGFFSPSSLSGALWEATRATGGLVLPAGDCTEMKQAFDTVALALREQYRVDFQPVHKIGHNRRISTQCSRPSVRIVAPERY